MEEKVQPNIHVLAPIVYSFLMLDIYLVDAPSFNHSEQALVDVSNAFSSLFALLKCLINV